MFILNKGMVCIKRLFFHRLIERCEFRVLSVMNHFSTAERSERVENFLFRATREYTEAGIEQATVAVRCLGANSPEPRRRAVPG